jgi:uncharacterized phage-associated protein
MTRTPLTFAGNEEKLRQLILYVSQKCADHPGFGSTKLNKIIYFADFLTYANTGKPLTGFEYQRLKHGPAPRKMKLVMDAMIASGQLAIQQVDAAGGYTTKKPVNLVSPDLDTHFSANEIATVDYVIDRFEELTATDTSKYSHSWGGWKYAHDGETIPYESVFIDNRSLTQEEQARGLEVAREYGKLDG